MFKNYKLKYFLLVILILGVFVVPLNFYKNMTKNVIDQIKYKNTLVTGEITADNGDGTYDVKINNANSAYKNVETVTYGTVFSVGEIVDIGYEYGNKESPKILGSAKKIPQKPKQVEVDYSGGCAGVQTETVTIYGNSADGYIGTPCESSYATVHNDNGSSLFPIDFDNYMILGQFYDGNYYISRGFLYFDISNIPSNAKIINAILGIYCKTDYSDSNWYIVIQDGQPTYPHNTLIGADFYYQNYKNNGGQVNAYGMATNAYTNIPLNSNGIAWIPKGGTFKICLRNSNDIANVAPTGQEVVDIYCSEKDGDYRPKLTLTYEI